MKLSIWGWLLWTLPLWLLMELGAFLIIGLVFKKTTRELIDPFLAFAVPAFIFMPLVWWLRMREEHGDSPKRLARGWFLSMWLFRIAVIVATLYLGVELRLMDLNDALGGFVAAILLSIPALYFIGYRWTLVVISARKAKSCGGSISDSSNDACGPC